MEQRDRYSLDGPPNTTVLVPHKDSKERKCGVEVYVDQIRTGGQSEGLAPMDKFTAILGSSCILYYGHTDKRATFSAKMQ